MNKEEKRLIGEQFNMLKEAEDRREYLNHIKYQIGKIEINDTDFVLKLKDLLNKYFHITLRVSNDVNNANYQINKVFNKEILNLDNYSNNEYE